MSDDNEHQDWVPDEALDALTAEREFHPAEDEKQLTRRLFRENSPVAAMGIINTAKHDPNSRVRLDAQKYIIERVLGKVGDDATGDKLPLETFLAQVEAAANKGSD